VAHSAEGAVLSGPALEGTLEELVDEVHDAGDALAEHQGTQTIARYRRAVQGFVHFVVRGVYGTERHRSRPSALKGTQKEYTLIRTIDRRLETLAADLLRGQIKQIEILRRVEEINGLIVDLVR